MKSLVHLTIFVWTITLLLSGCSTPSGGSISIDWEDKQARNEHEEPKVSKKKGPPDHAPAHGYRAKHAYRYYPNERTYYDSKRKLYFYIEKDGWTFGATLPSNIRLSNEYVTVNVDTDKPYEYYEEHEKKYPPGKSKKDKKKKGNKWANK